MLALKGRYGGREVFLDSTPPGAAPDSTLPETADDGSLASLFRDYTDDGIREPPVCFGEAVGNERW